MAGGECQSSPINKNNFMEGQQLRKQDYLFAFLQRPEVFDHFLFTTYSLHPFPGKVGWSIDAKLRIPLPPEIHAQLTYIMPYRTKKDAGDGCWVLFWKGFYSI